MGSVDKAQGAARSIYENVRFVCILYCAPTLCSCAFPPLHPDGTRSDDSVSNRSKATLSFKRLSTPSTCSSSSTLSFSIFCFFEPTLTPLPSFVLLSSSHQITATYSGSLQMLSEVTSDAQAKIQALSNALLEQLGTLPVRHTFCLCA
jgi:hypothetical protein